MKRYFVILLFFLPFTKAFCQAVDRERVDSLRQEVNNAVADTTRIRLYHYLADELSEKQTSEALSYSSLALDLARKINDPRLLVKSYNNTGSIYRKHSDYAAALTSFRRALALASSLEENDVLMNTYLESGIAYLRISDLDSARISLQEGLRIAEEYGDKGMKASFFNMMGNVLMGENNYRDALDQYLGATRLFEELENRSGLTQALSNVGNMQYLLQNYDKAEDYALQSLVIAEQIKKQSSIAYSNRLLGRIYRKQKKWNAALDAYLAAINIYKAIDAKRDIAETHFNTGNIYFETADYQKALDQYFSAIRVERSIRDTANMAYAFTAIGSTYFVLDNHRNALTYFDTARLFSDKKNLAALSMDIHNQLSEIYASQNDYKKAYESHVLYSQVRDSLERIRNHQEAEELEAKYQTEKKENEIRMLNAENDMRVLQRNFVIGLAILALLLVGVFYNRYTIKARTNKKLEELDHVKSRFFANISHEFRTPLSLILGPLKKRLETEKDAADLRLMDRNARRLLALINQLLDLSKIETGNMQLQLSEVSVAHVIQVIFSSFSSLAQQKGIDYSLSMSDNPSKGIIDRDKVEKILYNLLSNAFKFTPEGGTIFVQAEQAEGQLIVHVKDSGIGIPANKLPFIFDRFYQVDASSTRSGEGTGIGLALSRELAELHQGKIAVNSTEQGTEFILTIPLEHKSYRKSLIVSAEVSESSELFVDEYIQTVHENEISDREQFPMILIAEDHPDMRAFIAENLRDHYNIVEADNGNAAWQEALDRVPDLIISDVMMPGMDGITLCEKVKTSEATSHIPFIMLTAKAGYESKIDGLQTGADDYLTKPFDARELIVRVKNLIDQRRRLRQIFKQHITLLPNDVQVTTADAAFLSKITAFLEKNYGDDQYGLEEFTMDISMSRMQLHRKMKALTGQSPGEFIRHFRLERAKQLLLLKSIQISEVAYQVGYTNLSNFTKIFKEFTGLTPSEYQSRKAS